jgi:predicted amidohydrolase YtcJ
MISNDLALRDANIITMNPEQPRAEALAVRDGRIVVVGAWDEVAPRTEGITVLELADKTVLPGLIDTHVHFLWTALSLAALDVSGAEDHPSLQDIIRHASVDSSPGELIFGMGFTEYALGTGRFSPIIEALDAVAPGSPVCLVGVTGHITAVNTLGLEFLALPDDTPGVMRDTNGWPNGLLADQANNLAFDAFSEHFGADEKAAEMITLAIEKAHSVGISFWSLCQPCRCALCSTTRRRT